MLCRSSKNYFLAGLSLSLLLQSTGALAWDRPNSAPKKVRLADDAAVTAIQSADISTFEAVYEKLEILQAWSSANCHENNGRECTQEQKDKLLPSLQAVFRAAQALSTDEAGTPEEQKEELKSLPKIFGDNDNDIRNKLEDAILLHRQVSILNKMKIQEYRSNSKGSPSQYASNELQKLLHWSIQLCKTNPNGKCTEDNLNEFRDVLEELDDTVAELIDETKDQINTAQRQKKSTLQAELQNLIQLARRISKLAKIQVSGFVDAARAARDELSKDFHAQKKAQKVARANAKKQKAGSTSPADSSADPDGAKKILVEHSDLTSEDLEKYILGFKAEIDPTTKEVKIYGRIPEKCQKEAPFTFVQKKKNTIKGCEGSVGFQIVDEDEKARKCIEEVWKNDEQRCTKGKPCISLGNLSLTKFTIPDQDATLRLFFRDATKDENDPASWSCTAFPNSPNDSLVSTATKMAEEKAKKQEQAKRKDRLTIQQISCNRTVQEIDEIALPALELARDWGLITESDAHSRQKILKGRKFDLVQAEIATASKDRLLELREMLKDQALSDPSDKQKVTDLLGSIFHRFAELNLFDEARSTIDSTIALGQTAEFERTLRQQATRLEIAQLHHIAQGGLNGNSELIKQYDPLMRKYQNEAMRACMSRGHIYTFNMYSGYNNQMGNNSMEDCISSMQVLQEAAQIPMVARQAEAQKMQLAYQMQGAIQQGLMGGGAGFPGQFPMNPHMNAIAGISGYQMGYPMPGMGGYQMGFPTQQGMGGFQMGYPMPGMSGYQMGFPTQQGMGGFQMGYPMMNHGMGPMGGMMNPMGMMPF